MKKTNRIIYNHFTFRTSSMTVHALIMINLRSFSNLDRLKRNLSVFLFVFFLNVLRENNKLIRVVFV